MIRLPYLWNCVLRFTSSYVRLAPRSSARSERGMNHWCKTMEVPQVSTFDDDSTGAQPGDPQRPDARPSEPANQPAQPSPPTPPPGYAAPLSQPWYPYPAYPAYPGQTYPGQTYPGQSMPSQPLPATGQPDPNAPAQPAQPWAPPGYPPQGPYSQPLPPGGYEGPYSQPLPAGGYAGPYSQPLPPGGYTGPVTGAPVTGAPAPGQAPPSQPWYPQAPYPGQLPLSQPLMYGMPPSTAVAVLDRPAARTPWYRVLARTIPLWARLAVIGVIVVAFAALEISGSDWAEGAKRVGIAAGIMALLLVLATAARSFAGMADKANELRRRQFINAAIGVVVLATTSGVGIGLPGPIHRVQAHVLEAQQIFPQAIAEYQFAGETPPNSDDLARVYNEWGDRLSATGQYGAAIDKFANVLNTFTGAANQIPHAQAATIADYLAWGKQASQQQKYDEATQHYDALLALSFCDATCQTTAAPLDATAYYNLAEADLRSGFYSGSVDAFHHLLNTYPTAPEALTVHADLAKALLGLGKQQITSTCSLAVPTYQELASKFADTPEGKQAAKDMKAPQPVKGTFTQGVPGGAFVALAKGLRGGMPDPDFTAAFDAAPKVAVHSDGTFQFGPMPQGAWDLIWGEAQGGFESYEFQYQPDNTPTYIATVGPLCPYDFGNINTTFPPII
jgi:tetratricopeptide (TPR) repeat protein